MREIPFYKPTITERESELIEEALHSENTTDTVAKFEEKLKELGADIAKIPVDDEKALMKFKLRVG